VLASGYKFIESILARRGSHEKEGGFMSTKKSSPSRRSRTVTWEDPAINAKAAATMNGLDFLRAMRDGNIPPPPILPLVDFRLAEVDTGRVVFEFNPAEWQYNPATTVHGGIACAVLDSAAACAVHSTLPARVGLTTLEVKVNYLRPITSETGLMRCEGTLIHKGSRIAVAEAKMLDGKGRLYAFAVSTCIIFEQAREEGGRKRR
jgi:uncharacterized protein (TIGR00369 family)